MEDGNRICLAATLDGDAWSVDMYEADAPRLTAPVEVTIAPGVELKEAAAVLRRLAAEMEATAGGPFLLQEEQEGVNVRMVEANTQILLEMANSQRAKHDQIINRMLGREE